MQLLVLLCFFFLIPQLALADDVNPGNETIGGGLINQFTVTINGQATVFTQPALQENEEVFFPFRALLRVFGAEIEWNSHEGATRIAADEKEYLLKMDLANLKVIVDENTTFALKMINSHAHIPLSLVQKIMNYDFSWDEETKNLHVERTPASFTIFRDLREAPQYRVVETFTGTASWYGGKFHGRETNNGEIFDENGFTAAHRTLPFNTYLRVTFLGSNKSTVVRINDRGPHVSGRILDLSRGAAEEIGLRPHGLGEVKVEVLSGYQPEP